MLGEVGGVCRGLGGGGLSIQWCGMIKRACAWEGALRLAHTGGGAASVPPTGTNA